MRPLFTAQPLPRATVREEIPEETRHPGSLTAKIRNWLLTDPEPLFTARARQVEHARKVAEAEADAQLQS